MEIAIAVALGHTVEFKGNIFVWGFYHPVYPTALTCHVWSTLNLLQPPLAPFENLLENLRESHHLCYLSLETPIDRTSFSILPDFIARDHTFSSVNCCELSPHTTSNCKSIQPSPAQQLKGIFPFITALQHHSSPSFTLSRLSIAL